MTDQPWVAPGSPSGEPPRPGPAEPGPPPGWTPPAPGSAPPPGYPAPPPAPGGPPGAPPYARLDVRPGIVPLRPLTLGDVYSGVFTAVRGNPGATIGLAAVTTFVFLLPTTALGAWLSGQSGLDLFAESSMASDTLPSGFGLGLLGLYLPSLGQAFSAILLAGFLAQVVGQAVLGRKVSMGATWRATRGRILPLVGAVLVTGVGFMLAVAVAVGIPVLLGVYADSAGAASGGVIALLVVLGLVLLFATMILLWTKWAFATPAIVLDRTGVFPSLGRSWTLAGGPFTSGFWRIFGIRLLTSVIVGIAGSLITFPIALVLGLVVGAVAAGGSDPSGLLVLQTVVTGIAGLITGALTTPFTAGVDALLYVDARIRREGLDVRLIQTTQGTAAPPWPVAS